MAEFQGPSFEEIQKANLDKLYQRNPEWQAQAGKENRPNLTLIKGPERDGNVIPFRGRQAKMIIAEGTDGLTHLVPESKVQAEPPGLAPVVDMFPGVPYEIMGVTGLEVDDENPAMGHEGRSFRHEPFDPDDTRPPAA